LIWENTASGGAAMAAERVTRNSDGCSDATPATPAMRTTKAMTTFRKTAFIRIVDTSLGMRLFT
jgi:hypothetical protein